MVANVNKKIKTKQIASVSMANFSFGVEIKTSPEMMSEDQIQKYCNGQKAKNTVKKEISYLNVFTNFLDKLGEKRTIEEIPEKELDNFLSQFFIGVKTKKGKLYEPDTLTGNRNSLQTVLVERGSKADLREGSNFVQSRKVLGSRRKELVKLGKGNKPNAARPISKEEVDHLFLSNYFGISTPVILQRTVWWYITQHFGHRACDEGRQMTFGDVKIEEDFSTGDEYLVWLTERSTKTRNGERLLGHKRSFNPKAFATGTDRCPVITFKAFVSHRPLEMCQKESALPSSQIQHRSQCVQDMVSQ